MTIASNKHSFILSYLQVPIKNFMQGQISQQALRIIVNNQELCKVDEPKYLV